MDLKSFVKLSLFSVALFLSTACASSIMMPTQKISQPPQDYALVTFIRATSFGGAIDFGMWDGDTLVGVLDPKAYIQYKAAPGEHMFMARAENWSGVKANLEAGKSYYILANVSMGVWKARVVLRPIVKNDTEYTQDNINGWLEKLKPTIPDPAKVDDYTNPRVEDVREAVENFYSGKATFSVLSPEDNY